ERCCRVCGLCRADIGAGGGAKPTAGGAVLGGPRGADRLGRAGGRVRRWGPGQARSAWDYPDTPLALGSAAGAPVGRSVGAALLPGSGGRSRTGGPLRPWLALVWTVRSTRRYLQLARIAAWHGLAGLFGGRSDPGTPGQLARRIRLVLEQAGPIFVKLGQAASTRTDLLP